jgi:hypothetical protein
LEKYHFLFLLTFRAYGAIIASPFISLSFPKFRERGVKEEQTSPLIPLSAGGEGAHENILQITRKNNEKIFYFFSLCSPHDKKASSNFLPLSTPWRGLG